MPTAQLQREGDTTWIDGVPALTGWVKLPTFIGALEAVLSVTDHPVDYVDLLGLSGLAFRTRWYVGEHGPTGCMCSPTGETPMVWSAFARGTGWQLEPFDADGWDTPTMRRLIPRIIDAINDGRPVLTVDRDLNSAVIYGHKRDQVTFLVHTYAQASVACDVSELGQDPALVVFVRIHRNAPSPGERLRAVLRDAVNAWQHRQWDTAVTDNLRSGRAALQAWMEFYDRVDEMAQHVDRHKLLGHALWNYRHLCKARRGAAAFLARTTDHLPGAEYELGQAQETYAREADLLDTVHDGTWGQMPELHQTFFGESRATLSREWTDTPIDAWDRAVREREQSLLRQALEIEETAIAWLQAALAKTAPYTVPR
jgi:hypothetical protein